MKQTSRVKKVEGVKGWAIVTARGTVTGKAPYDFYSNKKFADHYAMKANPLRGGGLRVVRVNITYSFTLHQEGELVTNY